MHVCREKGKWNGSGLVYNKDFSASKGQRVLSWSFTRNPSASYSFELPRYYLYAGCIDLALIFSDVLYLRPTCSERVESARSLSGESIGSDDRESRGGAKSAWQFIR